MNKFITLLCLSILVFSCIRRDIRNVGSMRLAGDNKGELQKVLDHFSESKSDSLKFRSAQYLIEHMKWHNGSFSEMDTILVEGFLFEDSLLRDWFEELNKPGYLRNTNREEPLRTYQKSEKVEFLKEVKKQYQEPEFLMDVRNLSASYLIEHINHAHAVWEPHRDMFRIDYKLFQRSVLPYRFQHELVMPLDNVFDDMYYKQFFGKLDTSNIDSCVSRFNFYFSQYGKVQHEQLALGPLSFLTLGEMGCMERTYAAANMYRSLGFPCEIDFTSIWLENPARHFWCRMPFDKREPLYFDAQIYKVNHNFEGRCLGKVFRKTFEPNLDAPYFIRRRREDIPSIFGSPTLRDVTDEYLETKEIAIPLNTTKYAGKLAYFCVFTINGWKPLAYGNVQKDNTVLFHKMPKGISGIVCFYQKGEFKPTSSFLHIDNKWEIKEVHPSDKEINMVLTRKYPWKKRMMGFAKRIVGAKFQGAHMADFSDAVDLDSIVDILEPEIHVFSGSAGKKYRYYRYISPNPWIRGEAAILQFLGVPDKDIKQEKAFPLLIKSEEEAGNSSNENIVRYMGEIIGNGKDIDKCHDESMETFLFGNWSGMDFGLPLAVDKILFAPRNANNGILAGDDYKLLYWDEAWKEFANKTAKYNYLKFNKVPDNTIYWLRNLSRGKEELPFIYEDGQQFFINFDSLNVGDGKADFFRLN